MIIKEELHVPTFVMDGQTGRKQYMSPREKGKGGERERERDNQAHLIT